MWPTKPPSAETAADYRSRGLWRGHHIRDYLPWAAREFGDRAAVVTRDRTLTFEEVEREAVRVAAALRRRGVTADDVVSFQLPNWPEAVILFQGIMKVGAVANPIVPIYRGHELRHILRQAQTSVVVIPGSFRNVDYPDLYRRIRADLPALREVVVVGEGELAGETRWEEFLASGDGLDFDPVHADPDQVAILLYTSGTTAAAKGALHSSNTLIYETFSLAEWFSLNECDIVFNPSPVTHVTGVVWALIAPFVLGCSVVLQDVWEPQVAWDLVRSTNATFMVFSTPFLSGLLDARSRDATADSPVRYLVCGGADIPSQLIEAASTAIGPAVRMYGATECPSATCTTRWDPPSARSKTDGRWIAPTEGRILDEDGHTLPAGAQGEIAWRGPDMFLGYLDATINDSAFTEDGLFRTGDLAVMDEAGYLRIVGRVKDIINRAGEKFSASEIEQLMHEHPAVREIGIVAMPDPDTVEKACAFVVLRPGARLDLPEVDRYLSGRDLSRRKIPERLVIIDELPKTASGKIQKHVLRELAAQTAVDGGSSAAD